MHCSPLKYLNKQQHLLRQGNTHRQWLDPVLTEASNKYSPRVQWQQELSQRISAHERKKSFTIFHKTAKHMNHIFGLTYKEYHISNLPSQPRQAALS